MKLVQGIRGIKNAEFDCTDRWGFSLKFPRGRYFQQFEKKRVENDLPQDGAAGKQTSGELIVDGYYDHC